MGGQTVSRVVTPARDDGLMRADLWSGISRTMVLAELIVGLAYARRVFSARTRTDVTEVISWTAVDILGRARRISLIVCFCARLDGSSLAMRFAIDTGTFVHIATSAVGHGFRHPRHGSASCGGYVLHRCSRSVCRRSVVSVGVTRSFARQLHEFCSPPVLSCFAAAFLCVDSAASPRAAAR